MITLKRREAALTGIFFIACLIFTISQYAEAAVSVDNNNGSGIFVNNTFGSSGQVEMLPEDLIFAAVPSDSVASEKPDRKTNYQINALKWEQTAEDFILRVFGDNPPTYTMYELFDPLRVIIDIADASMGATVNLPLDQPQGPVSLVNGKVLEDKEPYIARLEIFLNEDNSYTVERIDNDILIRFPKALADMQQEETVPVAVEMAATTVQVEEIAATPVETIVPDEPAPAITEETIITTESDMASATPETETIPPVTESSAELTPANDVETDPATVLFDVEINHTSSETLIYLKADGAIDDFKEVRLGRNVKANRPDRIYLDINNVKLAGPIETKNVGTAVARVRTAQRKTGFRMVFDSSLDTLFDYSLTVQPDGLLMTVQEPSPATALIAGIMKESDQSVEPEIAPQPEMVISTESTDLVAQATEPLQPLIPVASIVENTTKAPDTTSQSSNKSTGAKLGEDFAFAGYEKQRITVDFYKIDLHNVFRLFGEVSSLNMVVDEAVSGALTLALNNVPWDFALDIILNLKDLQKEERFNTIVISPKSKSFSWPERSLDTIEFKADLEILDVQQQEQEALRISKRQQVPETVVEAKKLIHQAQNKEKNGDFEAALPLYESAFKKWSENIVLAKRIAGMCLVNLSQNAKAVKYAKAALQINANDYDAALQAAIGLARMKKTELARSYFDLAVSGNNPLSEALASYSGFCEENQDFECAITMLKRHDDLHGDTLHTMLSRARILDKQGQRTGAANEYRALLLSGYEIPPGLSRFIKARVGMGGK